MWRSIADSVPAENGLYVVARFEGDKMIEYNLDYAKLDGYFGPNRQMGGLNRVELTHWMPYRDFRALLGLCPRDGRETPRWERFKEGDVEYLSVVYKDFSKHYGGYYIDFPEPGDLYIRLYDLGKPEVKEEDEP